MVTTLNEVTLKSGEAMKVIKTTAPEPDWIDRIIPFLSHKTGGWLGPMTDCYTAGLDDLGMNDFLGVINSGEVVGNITTLEFLGVAILQHVFTPPQHRRKGICDALMEALCKDFTARGGRAMYLGTGHDTPPFHIYERYGFVGRGDSGKMTWLPGPGFLETYFAPSEVTVRGTLWQDWPMLEALYAITGQWQLKSFLMSQFGHTGYESQYIGLRNGLADGKFLDTKVMVSKSGAVVGHALLGVQPSWKGRLLALDLMLHADFHDRIADLVAAVAFPEGPKVQVFTEASAHGKVAALEALGFKLEGVLWRQFEDENHELRDVLILGR